MKMGESHAFKDETNKLDELNKDQKDRLVSLTNNRWIDSTQDINELFEESREGWDFYLNNEPQAPKFGGGKLDAYSLSKAKKKSLRLGDIPRAVDSVLALLHNGLFPADERFFRGSPQNGVARDFQERYEQYLSDSFAQDNTTEQHRRFLLKLCIDPAACVGFPYRRKTREKVTYKAPTLRISGVEVPLPLLGLRKTTKKDFVDWEGTQMDVLDFSDWRVDPDAKTFEDSWFIRRWYDPVWRVKKDYEIKDVEPYDVTTRDDFTEDRSDIKEASGLTLPIDSQDEPQGRKDALLMIHYDDFVLGGEVFENHVAVVLNAKKCVWFGKNPYDHGQKPYSVHSLMPVPNQLYGKSLIRHAIKPAAVNDTIVERALEMASLGAKPIFEVDSTERALMGKDPIKPGTKYPVRKVGNAIRQIPIQTPNLPILVDILERMKQAIQESTGATPVFSGEDPSKQTGNVTAFQVDQHVQGANSRFQALMNDYKNCVIERQLYQTFENDKQFKSKTEYVNIGQIQKELTPDEIKQMEMRWVITAGQASNTRGKQLANLRGLLLEIMPPLIQNGLVQLKPQGAQFDHIRALQDLFVMAGITNADKLLEVQALPETSLADIGGVNGQAGVQQPGAGGAGLPNSPALPQPGLPSTGAPNGAGPPA